MKSLGSCQLSANVNVYIYFAAVFFSLKIFVCIYIHTLLWLVCIPENRIAALQRGVSFYFCVWDSPLCEGVQRQVDLESQRDPAMQVAGLERLLVPAIHSLFSRHTTRTARGQGEIGRESPSLPSPTLSRLPSRLGKEVCNLR